MTLLMAIRSEYGNKIWAFFVPPNIERDTLIGFEDLLPFFLSPHTEFACWNLWETALAVRWIYTGLHRVQASSHVNVCLSQKPPLFARA